MAPADKVAVLKSLPASDAFRTILSFSSVNQELLDSLVGHGEGTNAPCVFQKQLQTATKAAEESDSTFDRAAAALNAGNLAQSAQLVSTALQQNQTNAVATYLARIIEREQLLAEKK
jgi:hypothetical protein